MKDKLTEALNHISDKHIAEASGAKSRRRYQIPATIAAILALVLVIGLMLQPLIPGNPADITLSNKFLVAQPQYPQMTPYPADYTDDDGYLNWQADQLALHRQPEGYADSLSHYFAAITGQLLSNTKGENAACSPVNIYLALAMLAETTDGNSRQQILDLLGADSIDKIRTQAEQVWKAHYNNDGLTTSILANSLWLEEGYPYNKETVQLLAEKYYASVFQGDLGTEEMDKALRNWINEQTGGLLQEQANKLSLDPQTVLALVSTLHYQVQWLNEFQEKENTESTFYGTAGNTIETFMRQTLIYNPYYWSDHFGAVSLNLEDNGRMWLILPDEGVTPEELLSTGEAMDFLQQNANEYENQKSLMIHLSVPKFDISSDLEISRQLEALGITDIFVPGTADFTPIIPENDGGYVSQVKHAARVAIDEEGVTAAAFTMIARCGAGMPPKDETDFTLDRPFLFVIESQDGLPLFAGIVNQP